MNGPDRPTPLYRNLSFTLMWTSTAASGFGDRMIMLGAWALLGGMVAGNDDSTGVQASTQFFFFLPYILISIPGGWLADHLPRKWLLLSCDEFRAALLFASFFFLASATGPANLPQDQVWFELPLPAIDLGLIRITDWTYYRHYNVYAALAAIGSFAAIFNPTRNAIVPQIVPTRQLQAANAIILVISVVASMIGMVIGGLIINAEQAASVRTGLLMGASFYLVSGVFFAFLRPSADVVAPDQAPSRSLWRAARYARRHRRVLILFALGVLVWSSAAAVSSAVPGVVKHHYGVEGDALISAFTKISAVLGAGMLAGAGVVVAIGTRKESPVFAMTGLIAAGACILLFALVPWWFMTYAAAFLIGVFGNIVIITVLTLLQSITPNYMRGRVMGINAMVNTIFSVTTYFMIWRLPNADRNILFVLYTLGPALAVVGLFGLTRFLTSGPTDSAALNFFWRINRLFCFVVHRVVFIGRHRVPSHGAVVLASNHTAALDPFAIQTAINRPVRWLMLTPYLLWPLRPMWKAIKPIALDRNSSDAAKLKTVAETLRRSEIVGIFPEGGLQRRSRQLRPFEPGTAVMARLGKAVIVPVWVHGTPRANSMLRHMLQPSRTTVVFGEPFTPARDATPEQVMEELRRRMLGLPEQIPANRVRYKPV